MKILHYIPHFSQRSETFLYDLICNLEFECLDNYILAHKRELEKERPFKKVKLTNEKKFFFKRVYCKLFSLSRFRNEIDVVEYISELNPTLIHAHFGVNGAKIYQLLMKYKIDIPLVVSLHGQDINVLPQKHERYRKSLISMGGGDGVTFTSPSLFLKNKATGLGIPKQKIYVIPNAVNDYFIRDKSKRKWECGEHLKLLNIGRFEEVKGHEYLIDAFKKIVHYYPNCSLTLIGYGELESQINKQIENLGLSTNIVLIKEASHRDLPSLISSCHIYIQPSIVASDGAEESLSVSTIEAQTMGLPAIVSKIGGLVEVVRDKQTGFFVEAKNADDIFDKVKCYINNEDTLHDHSISASLESSMKFKKNILIPKWINLYDKIKRC